MSTLYHATQQSPIPTCPGIYKIVCQTTGKLYIGSATNLRKRWKDHCYYLNQKAHHNPKLQAAWNKYGPDAFIFEIIEIVLTPELLTAREQHWFNTLQPFGKKGFNIAHIAGSSLGRIVSQSTRNKIGDAQRGKPRPNQRGKKKSSKAIEQHKLALTGYKHTEEARCNMSNARKGKKHSPEVKEKIHLANLGHDVSPETRAKIIAANTGRIFSTETRTNMSIAGKRRQRTPEEYASRKKTLIVTSPIGETYTITGIEAFCIEHGLDCSALIKVARGKYRHHHGWTARYAEPDAS